MNCLGLVIHLKLLIIGSLYFIGIYDPKLSTRFVDLRPFIIILAKTGIRLIKSQLRCRSMRKFIAFLALRVKPNLSFLANLRIDSLCNKQYE